MGSSNAGASNFTLFTDAIDEARARGAREARKARIGRPKRHLADIELRSLKQLETVSRRLGRKLVKMGPDWLPDEAFISAITETAGAITKLSRSLRLAREAEAKAMGDLTGDQLDEVFRVQLPRVAPMLTEEDWRSLLSIGMGEDIAEAAITVWKQRAGAPKP